MGDDAKKVASKLHQQFGHPTAEKLIKLVKASDYFSEELQKEIYRISDKCEICVKFKKPPPRPVVSIPLATKFNETVSMDLVVWKQNLYFLVIVDVATRFCMSCVIRDKKPSTVIKSFLKCWISMFGPPHKILSDNGGEFNNSEMRQLGDTFNIRVLTTAAESPWSNGICERLNAVLSRSVEKIVADTQCDIDVALAWAVAARNALTNFTGYAPNQLVFGHNPIIPNVFSNELPALEEVSSSEMVRQNLDAMHAARQEFLRCESSEKIRRALRSNIRNTSSDNLVNGDKVFYKRNDDNEWHGPGIVIGRDGKQVMVRHGGTYVRVHVCRLNRSPDSTNVNQHPITIESPVHEEVKISTATSDCDASFSDDENGATVEIENGAIPDEMNTSAEVTSKNDSTEGNSDEIAAPAVHSVTNSDALTTKRKATTTKFNIGMRFEGVDTNTGEAVNGKIVSRAGKATGKHKNSFNVKNDSDGTVNWINMDTVADLKIIPESEERVVMFSSNEACLAKDKEMDNWLDNDVFEEVDDIGQERISSRWVVTEKVKCGETVTKARLVARGFEEDTMCIRKDSPTCSKESVRIVLSVTISFGWQIHSVDVKAAYLQGDTINRDLYLKPPPEYDNGKLWRLKKTVYGLCDAARAWYNRVKGVLLSMSAVMCTLEPSVFYWYNREKLEGIICVYVDDFLWAGTRTFEREVIDKVRESFLIGSSESESFKYVGLNINSSKGVAFVDQNQYILTLSPVKISVARSSIKSSELSEQEKREFRSVIGQLNWIATNSRPDISFEVSELSASFKNACIADLLRLNKLVKWIQQESYRIAFRALKSLEGCTLECYSDASFANLNDSSSQGGFVIFMQDSRGVRCPVQWQSRKVRRVVKSTLAAETLALLDCAEAAVYIAKMLNEIVKCEIKVNCIVDNKSLCDALYSSHVLEDRRLRIDLAVLRNMLDREEINRVSWVATSVQLADCLTKRGASAQRLMAALCDI